MYSQYSWRECAGHISHKVISPWIINMSIIIHTTLYSFILVNIKKSQYGIIFNEKILVLINYFKIEQPTKENHLNKITFLLIVSLILDESYKYLINRMIKIDTPSVKNALHKQKVRILRYLYISNQFNNTALYTYQHKLLYYSKYLKTSIIFNIQYKILIAKLTYSILINLYLNQTQYIFMYLIAILITFFIGNYKNTNYFFTSKCHNKIYNPLYKNRYAHRLPMEFHKKNLFPRMPINVNHIINFLMMIILLNNYYLIKNMSLIRVLFTWIIPNCNWIINNLQKNIEWKSANLFLQKAQRQRSQIVSGKNYPISLVNLSIYDVFYTLAPQLFKQNQVVDHEIYQFLIDHNISIVYALTTKLQDTKLINSKDIIQAINKVLCL